MFVPSTFGDSKFVVSLKTIRTFNNKTNDVSVRKTDYNIQAINKLLMEVIKKFCQKNT